MPIRIITGLPGHGKTLRMVDELHAAAKEGNRPLFQCGIAGLAPGLATEITNPLDWNAIDTTREGTCTCGYTFLLDEEGNKVYVDNVAVKVPGRPPHAHIVPDGSLIFVDEAWKWFGHLHNASGQKTPNHVLEFAEHRHRGLDFVMTTQGPGQMYPFLRTLIEGHTHVVRIMGTQSANTYTWPELNDDVKSRAMREAAQRSMWAYPKKHYDAYKSATVHTIKRNIPWKLVLIPLSAVGAIVAAYLAYDQLKPSNRGTTIEASMAEAQVPGSPGASAPTKGKTATALERLEPEAVREYFAKFTPRNSALPASAPAYDDRDVTAEPRLLCLVVGPGHDASGEFIAEDRCFCRTEQYTVWALDDKTCRMRADQGEPYDHFKRPPGDRWGAERTAGDFQQTGRKAAPVAQMIEAPQISGYGDLGIALKPGTP